MEAALHPNKLCYTTISHAGWWNAFLSTHKTAPLPPPIEQSPSWNHQALYKLVWVPCPLCTSQRSWLSQLISSSHIWLNIHQVCQHVPDLSYSCLQAPHMPHHPAPPLKGKSTDTRGWGCSVSSIAMATSLSGTSTEDLTMMLWLLWNPASLRPFFICQETGHLAAHHKEKAKGMPLYPLEKANVFTSDPSIIRGITPIPSFFQGGHQ